MKRFAILFEAGAVVVAIFYTPSVHSIGWLGFVGLFDLFQRNL